MTEKSCVDNEANLSWFQISCLSLNGTYKYEWTYSRVRKDYPKSKGVQWSKVGLLKGPSWSDKRMS